LSRMMMVFVVYLPKSRLRVAALFIWGRRPHTECNGPVRNLTGLIQNLTLTNQNSEPTPKSTTIGKLYCRMIG
jgi:hypothetical protein